MSTAILTLDEAAKRLHKSRRCSGDGYVLIRMMPPGDRCSLWLAALG